MQSQKWVAGWGCAISTVAQAYAEYVKDQTFRYYIFSPMKGQAIRLHLSNERGVMPSTVTKMTVAIATSETSIDVSTVKDVTFGGKESVTLEVGQKAVSDEIEFSVEAGQSYMVSMYFGELTHIASGHSNGGHFIKKHYGLGDHTGAERIPLELLGDGGPYVLLNTIDLLTDESDDCRAIIAYGDSITAQPWPDFFNHRVFDSGIINRPIIRKGIGGSRVLRDYQYRCRQHYGEKGILRFEKDIAQAGVDRVFILHGINDLIHPGGVYSPMSDLPTAQELIEGYKTYIAAARRQGIKIYMATILPCPRCMNGDGVREQVRCTVNDWIRNEAPIDGVIDFEAAVWDENDHKQMKAEYDSGDHLHPSLAGAKKMADSIPMEFVTE